MTTHLPPEQLDIETLRIPVEYGASLGVKRRVVAVPVGRPPKTTFIRVHPDPAMRFAAAIYEDKANSVAYLVRPEIADLFPELARRVELFRATDRQTNERLIPVPLPGDDGQRNPWHESLLDALLIGTESWVRVVANKSMGAYEAHVAQGQLSDPVWSASSIEDLVKTAFRSRIIDTEEHAVINALMGKV